MNGKSLLVLAFFLLWSAAPAPALAEGLSLGGSLTAGLEFNLNSPYIVENTAAVFDGRLTQTFGERGALAVRLEIDESGLVRLREAFADLYLGRTDFRLGKQRIAWGTADGVNPTDNLNPVDYDRPFEEDNRLEVLALKVDHYWGDWTLEFVWLPVFVPAAQPAPGSRWYPPTTPPSLPPGLTLGELTFAPSVLPVGELSNSETALKLARTAKGVDYSFSYFRGWDDLPTMHTNIVMVAPGVVDVTITPVYHRLEVLGADFAATHGKFGFRGEAAWFLTEDRTRTDPEIKNPYYQLVLGADYTPGEKLYFGAQLVGEYVTPSAGTPGPDEGAAYAIMGELQYKPNFKWQWALDGVYNLTDTDFLLRPSVSWSPADGITLRAGLVILDGPAGTWFGQFAGNDYGFVELKMSF